MPQTGPRYCVLCHLITTTAELSSRGLEENAVPHENGDGIILPGTCLVRSVALQAIELQAWEPASELF